METTSRRCPQENQKHKGKDRVFKNKDPIHEKQTLDPFGTDELKIQTSVGRRILGKIFLQDSILESKGSSLAFLFRDSWDTCIINSRPRLDPCRARIGLFELEHSINLKLQFFFSDFSKGLNALLGQNTFFLRFGE